MNRRNQSFTNRIMLYLLVIFLLGYSNIGYCKTSKLVELLHPNSSKDEKSAAVLVSSKSASPIMKVSRKPSSFGNTVSAAGSKSPNQAIVVVKLLGGSDSFKNKKNTSDLKSSELASPIMKVSRKPSSFGNIDSAGDSVMESEMTGYFMPAIVITIFFVIVSCFRTRRKRSGCRIDSSRDWAVQRSGCRIDSSRDWAARGARELRIYGNKGVFVTLTYNSVHLPKDRSLSPYHINLFMTNLRQYVFRHISDCKIKFFVCGEYGAAHRRPHYHLIVFGLSKEDFIDLYTLPFKLYNGKEDPMYGSKILSSLWNNMGACTINDATYGSVCYVAQYVSKKRFANYSGFGKYPEFIWMI